MSIENFNKEVFSPEEQLGNFFDEEQGKNLKDKLSKEEYDKLREDFIADGIDLEYVNESREKELYKAKYDELTGLKRRGELFSIANKEIERIFGIKKNGIETREDLERILFDESKNIETEKIHIMMGDISFLSIANEGGNHASGDELLKKIADRLKSNIRNVCRHGGDEVTTIYKGDFEDFNKILKKTQSEINAIDDHSVMNKYDLEVNLDVGTASMAEAISVLKELSIGGMVGREAGSNILSDLKDIWLEIADKRASVAKAQKRIRLLLERKNQNKEIMSGLRKGAYDINDTEIAYLLNNNNLDENIDKYIKDSEEAMLQAQEDKLKKERSELILKKIGVL
ncbi:hypothetical protein C0583_03035 [Candidatus Parcubacteria bacterium]|nr:MAG: hypothetical protein C0583_03035 [Candidatus Parcubacteria bacterium]